MADGKVSSWLSLAANIGVLAGVVFVAVEVRQTGDAVRTTNSQSSIALGMEVGAWLKDPEFAEVYLNVLESRKALTDVERIQFDEFLGARLNIWEFSFNAHESGTMSDKDWDSWDAWFVYWLRQDGVRDFWVRYKREQYLGATAFLEHVDSLVPP
jgi:hypothetical protein